MPGLGLTVLVLWSGFLVPPFRISDAAPGHHQTCLRAAMAPSGDFAVAWVDAEPLGYPRIGGDIYIRFFDRDGRPRTAPYRVARLADTTLRFWPCLEMDALGNVLLVWIDGTSLPTGRTVNALRYQFFSPSGLPVDTARSYLDSTMKYGINRPIDASLADNGRFVVTWVFGTMQRIWFQRFNRLGPIGGPRAVRDTVTFPPVPCYPQVALNGADDVVVTWLDAIVTMQVYPRFQVFDRYNIPFPSGDPMGHRIDDEGDAYHGSRVEVRWLDNDRFAAFWSSVYPDFPEAIRGRVFSNRGRDRHPVSTIVSSTQDSIEVFGTTAAFFSTALFPDGRFAVNYGRRHYEPERPEFFWDHEAGVLGRIDANIPQPTAGWFEYTPPYGADTTGLWDPLPDPATACSRDRIVWVYSRTNADTVFEAFATISDWDMTAVAEPPAAPVARRFDSDPIGRATTIRYQGYPHGFRATVFDASGRRVSEVRSAPVSGSTVWGAGTRPGVYFIRVDEGPVRVAKFVLVR